MEVQVSRFTEEWMGIERDSDADLIYQLHLESLGILIKGILLILI